MPSRTRKEVYLRARAFEQGGICCFREEPQHRGKGVLAHPVGTGSPEVKPVGLPRKKPR
jgi:hypothetical protein